MASRDPNLAGVGGWLAFFIIVIAAISPLRLVVETAQLTEDAELVAMFGEEIDTIARFEWALVAISIAGFWFLAWRLAKVHVWRSVQLTIAGIWILGPGLALLEIAAMARFMELPPGGLPIAIGFALAQPVIFCLIWTAYFLKSVRVANTYGKPGAARVEEVFR